MCGAAQGLNDLWGCFLVTFIVARARGEPAVTPLAPATFIGDLAGDI